MPGSRDDRPTGDAVLLIPAAEGRASFSKHSVNRLAIVSDGMASVPRAITADVLLYARETDASGGCADLLLCDGEGKLSLAWLAGRSTYLIH